MRPWVIFLVGSYLVSPKWLLNLCVSRAQTRFYRCNFSVHVRLRHSTQDSRPWLYSLGSRTVHTVTLTSVTLHSGELSRMETLPIVLLCPWASWVVGRMDFVIWNLSFLICILKSLNEMVWGSFLVPTSPSSWDSEWLLLTHQQDPKLQVQFRAAEHCLPFLIQWLLLNLCPWICQTED